MERTQATMESSLSKRDKCVLDTALCAGALLMESGAETYRVEDTVERILSQIDHQKVDVVALLTGLYVTLTLKDGSYVSSIRRIKVRDLRLDRIHEINEISRSLSAHTMDIEEAFHALKAIESDHSDLHFRFYYFALAAGGFALMMGATVLESIIGGLAACTVILSRKMVRGRISGSFIPSFLHAFIITFTLGLVVRFFPILHLDRMVIGSLISLFPGTTLTTGIRDTMKADYLTGAGNLISALVSAMALVVGTYFAMVLTGGRFL